MEDLNKKPTVFSDTIGLLDEMLNEEQKKELAETKEQDIARFHFSLGSWIRNNWIYDKGSPLGVEVRKNYPTDIDGYSAAIIKVYHRHLCNKPLNTDAELSKLISLANMQKGTYRR